MKERIMRPRIQKGLSLVTSLAMVMTMCTGFTSVSWADEASSDNGSQALENAAGGGSSISQNGVSANEVQEDVQAKDVSAQESTFKGSGTEADPYILSTAADLVNLATKVNNGDNYSGSYFQLANSIDLSEQSGFVPIGTTSNYFKGYFDGKGYTITLNIADQKLTGAGLFGAAGGGAVIQNVTIAGSVKAYLNVAGLVGQAKANLTIKNCINKADVTSGVGTSGKYGTGGLVGISNDGYITLEDCKNIGVVSRWDTGSTKNIYTVFGGVIGGIWGSSYAKEVLISNCVNGGTVKDAYSAVGIGGIIGKIYATAAAIESCENSGAVSAVGTSTATSDGVGGIAGCITGTAVSQCSNNGTLTGQNNKSAKTGGIVGQVNDASSIVTECVNKGAVSTAESCSGYVGGVVGYTSAASSITSSYNAGVVTNNYTGATSSSTPAYAGGVLGYTSSSSQKVQNCYSYGTVSCSATGTYKSIGGVIGKTYSSSPSSAYINSNAYLSGSASKGIGNVLSDNDGYNSFTNDESGIASLLTTVGSAYQNDLAAQINNGYPILRWQNPDATYKATFVIKDAETNASLDSSATVTLKDEKDEPVAGTDNAFELSPGTYTYSVERAGYTSVSDSLTIAKASKDIEVKLTSIKHPFALKVSPAAAQVKITSGGGAPGDSCKTGEATIDEATDTATYTLSLADDAAYGAYEAEVKHYNYVTQSGVELKATADSQEKSITLAAAAKHALSLNVTPSDAKVYITNTDWDKESDASQANEGERTYQLIDGNYSYKVKASGYKTFSGTFTMEGADKNLDPVTLESKAAWDGKSIDTDWYTRNPDATNFEISEPEELAGLAALVNCYDPATGKAPVEGLAAVDFSGKTISLTKDIDLGGSAACSDDSWTGWTAIGYTNNTNIFFSGTFNGNGHSIKNLYIDVTGTGAAADGYRGLFGKTDNASITDLTLENVSISSKTTTGYQNVGGLVGKASNTVVRNVAVTGEIIIPQAGYYAGGLFGSFSGTAVDCVNHANVTSGYKVGGISGETNDSSATTYLRCANYGKIVASVAEGTTVTYSAGGISGYINNKDDVVKYCVNYGEISGAAVSAGGIVGCNNSLKAQKIEGCYNLGIVGSSNTSAKGIGGIIGYVKSGGTSGSTGISNCYNGASLTGTKNVAGVAGYLASSSLDNTVIYNNYYLASDAYSGANNSSGALTVEAFTAFDKSEVNATFISNLGNAYGPYVDGLSGCDANKTDDVNWPILRWQNPGSSYEVGFSFTYDDESNKGEAAPVVTVTDANDNTKTYTANEEGKVQLPNGSYTYSVAADGYAQATGEFTVDQDAVAIKVELVANRCAYTITAPRSKGDKFSLELVKVTNDGDVAVKASESKDLPDADNITSSEYNYSLTNGTYKYTAKRFGYEKLTGQFVVNGEASNSLALSQTQLGAGTLTAAVAAESGEFADNQPTIEVYAKGGDFDGQQVMSCDKSSSIFSSGLKLYAGSYTYKVKADGYTTVEGEFELTAGGSYAIAAEMQVKTGWGGAEDFDTDWYTNHTDATEYTLTNVSQLAGVAKLVNDGTTNFEGKTVKLACDMDLSDNAWTPIGDMSKPFKGTFDGQNHVVSMKKGQLNASGYFSGLFGATDGATVKNVVMQGSTKIDCSSESSLMLYAGALIGMAKSSSVANCSNQMTFTVILESAEGTVSTNIGGLVGWSVLTSFKACSNVGEISVKGSGSSTTNVYVGGVVGFQNSSGQVSSVISDCYNTGDISSKAESSKSSSNSYAGGLIGNLLASTGFSMSNCYNAGYATASAVTSTSANALIGKGSTSNSTNNYYLDNGLDSGLSSCTKKTETEMKSADFVTALNGEGNAYIANPNGGYPILSWEKGIDHIAVTTQPNKLAYNDLENFDDTGMKITAYSGKADIDGSEVVSGWNITGGKKMAAGTTYVTVNYKGASVQLPITVTAVDHEVTADDLNLDIAAPQAGATPQNAVELTADQSSKFSANLSWTCAGKAFEGNFKAGKFYRAHVKLTSKYNAGVMQWVFANGAWPSISTAYETLNYTQSTDANGKLTTTEFDITFAPVGYAGSIEPKMFHAYYEGDAGTGKAYDLGGNELKVTVGNAMASTVSAAEIETSILRGDISAQKLSVDGTEYVGIDLLSLLEADGVARTTADDTSITFSNGNASGTGDVVMTYGEIRQMAADSAAIVAFASASDSMPLGSGTGPLMFVSSNGARTCLSSIVVDEPAAAASQKLSFEVGASDGATLDVAKLDITIRDGYGHKIVVDTKNSKTATDVRDGDTYSYRVTYKGYNVATGSVKVSGKARTVKVTLNPVWDGTTTSQPKTASDGYIEIGTAAELMYWHDHYNATDKVRLTADIALNDGENNTNVWEVLGTNSGYSSTGTLAFAGTFDGNGHVIRNILIQRENTYELEIAWDGSVMAFADRVSEIGFFGYTGGNATIKDLGLEGTIDVFDRPDSSLADWLQVGGIVGLAQGNTKISGCYTNMAIRAVASTQTDTVGGYPLAGFGYVTDIYMGGIAGSLSATSTVSDCYTKGTFIGAETRQVSIGGVVGALRYSTNSVTNCYSTATIDARPLGTSTWDSWLGGVVGVNYNYSAGKVTDSYALNSSITGNSVHMHAGKVTARAESGALSGNYALDSMTVTGADTSTSTGATSINGESVTMGSATSGKAYSNWSEDTWKFTNGDEGVLPMLAWQKTQAGEANTITYDGQDNSATDDDWDGYFGSQSAPPYFKVYARVGNQSIVLKKFTRDEMKTMAAADYTGTQYYSSVSSNGYAGRAVKEYVTLDTLLEAAGVKWVDGDAIIMGNYRYDLNALTAERYYYPEWTSGSDKDAVAVKPVIAIKSNGAKSGMSKEILPMYAQQADCLYAYMLTFGQSKPTESSYGYFIYQQVQMGVDFKPASKASETLTNYLSDLIAQAEADRDATYVSADGSDVAGSAYYVSQADKDTFSTAIQAAKSALANSDAVNEDTMNAITALTSAQTKFDKAKQQGKGVNRSALNTVIEKATSTAYNAKVSVDGTDISVAYTWATQEAVDTLKAAINSASSVYFDQTVSQAQIDEAARTLQAALSSFKVDKGTKEVAYRAAKIQELTSYAGALDQSKLTSYQKQQVQEALSTYVAKIKAAQSVEGIDDAFNMGKAAIDAAAVAKQDSGSGGSGGSTTDITKAKADAKAVLQTLVDNSGLADADKQAVQKLADEYASKIDAATTNGGVDSALSDGKSAVSKKIDELKLAAAKADAKAQLEAYAKEKGASYADQDALQKAVDAALTLIDTATSTSDVATQLAAGKAAIDALVSGGGQDDELARAKANAKAELADILSAAKIDDDAKAAVRDIMIDYVLSIDAATSVSGVNKLLLKGSSDMKSFIGFVTSGTTTVTQANVSYKLFYKSGKAQLVKLSAKAKKAKSIKIPATVSYCGTNYKVTSVASKACAKQVKATTLTIGSNVKTVKANAFAGCKKLATVTVASKKLTKASIKNLVKNTKVKVIKVKVSKKSSVNKKYVAKYGKWAKSYNGKVAVR